MKIIAYIRLFVFIRGSGGLDVQAALGLAEILPTAGARIVVAGQAGAGIATDRTVSAVEQRIVGYVIGVHIPPELFVRPVYQRVELDELVLVAPLDYLSRRARRAVGAPHARDPGAV